MTAVAEKAEASARENVYQTLPQKIREWASRTPNAVAMREKDLGIWREITWAQLWEDVLAAAHGLLALGIQPGDRVSIHSEDRPEWVILDLATVAVRGITVGLYPTNPAAEVKYLLSDSGSRIHLAEDQEQADKVMEVIVCLPDLERDHPCRAPRLSSMARRRPVHLLGRTSWRWGGRHRAENPEAVENDHGGGAGRRRDDPRLHVGYHRPAQRGDAHQCQLLLLSADTVIMADRSDRRAMCLPNQIRPDPDLSAPLPCRRANLLDLDPGRIAGRC